jgi:hypothetical protein
MLYKSFEIGTKEYKARLTAKACIELEKKLGTNPLNLFSAMASTGELPPIGEILIILHQALLHYHHGLKLEEVYDLYDEFVDEGKTLVDLMPIMLDIFKVSGFYKETEHPN